MAIIDKDGLSLVLDAIKKENPTVPVGIDSETVLLTDTHLVGIYGKGYVGSVPINYPMIDLSSLLGPSILKIGVKAPTTLYNAFGDITRCLGITFTPNDVEDVPIPLNAELPYDVTVSAKSSSALYIGSAVIQFVSRDPLISEVITAIEPPVGYDLLSSNYKTELLTYQYDYTVASEALAAYSTDTVLSLANANQLTLILNSVDPINWLVSDLTGKLVVYNGDTINSGLMANTFYEKVMIIRLTNSYLYLHYNVRS
jgi:hypothetical protein